MNKQRNIKAGATSIFNNPINYLALGHLKDVESFIGKKIDQLSPPFPQLESAINNVHRSVKKVMN